MITGLDHIVLAVGDVARTLGFYRDKLGVEAELDGNGKWMLRLGDQQVNLQSTDNLPAMARNTVPGGGNFCMLTSENPHAFAHRMRDQGVEILKGPVERAGAVGPIVSVYLRDPDGNLVEVSRPL